VKLRTILFGLLVLFLAVPLPGLLAALRVSASAEFDELPSSTREYAAITHHLRRPFDGYSDLDTLLPQFKIVALSHMASGFLNVYVAEPAKRSEVEEYLREIVRRALAASVAPTGLAPTLAKPPLDDYNLYWSHLAIVLGAERFVRCEGKQCPIDTDTDRLDQRIVDHLRARTLSTGVYHAPSYPGSSMWPADQTVTLLAMKLFDVTSGTYLLDEPLRGFLATVHARRDLETGLFPSSVSPIPYAGVARGCASSFGMAYLAQLDSRVAYDQYTNMQIAMRRDILGLGGFREWPEGTGGSADVDSGPILLGVGVAATGLGLAPARIFHDVDAYTVIRRTALTFGLPAWWKSGGYWAAPLLGEAILFDGRTARAWFVKAPTAPQRPAPAPVGVVVLLVLEITAMGAAVWRWMVRR
jgi:hypothetical protein